MIHFIRPLCLFALIPVMPYLLWVIYSLREANPWKKVCDPHLLPALLQQNPTRSTIFFNFILFLLFTISILALAGPAWNKTKLPVYRNINSMMLVLDLSAAMQASDLKPDRLTRAKLKIRDLINDSKNTQMGLVVFTEEAFVASPLSQDANTLNGLLDELRPQMMPVAGSEMGQGLEQGLKLLIQAGARRSNLLLITASAPTAASWEIAQSIKEAGDHLNILAMLDETAETESTINQLKQLADAGNGSFYLFSADAADIQSIANNHDAKQTIADEKLENAHLWQDAGPWFCLFLIPLALLVLREKARHEKNV